MGPYFFYVQPTIKKFLTHSKIQLYNNNARVKKRG